MRYPRKFELHNFVNLRMGASGTLCIFIAIFGKRFGASRLKDVSIGASLIDTGSAERVIKGKQYN